MFWTKPQWYLMKIFMDVKYSNKWLWFLFSNIFETLEREVILERVTVTLSINWYHFGYFLPVSRLHIITELGPPLPPRIIIFIATALHGTYMCWKLVKVNKKLISCETFLQNTYRQIRSINWRCTRSWIFQFHEGQNNFIPSQGCCL